MSHIPPYIAKYFWGDNLDELSWEKHKDYIIKIILEKGDITEVRWLFKKVDKKYLLKIVNNSKMEPISKNFWIFYLS